MRRPLFICLGLIGLICGAFPGAAVGGVDFAADATFSPDSVETGFKLHGSNGYAISVVAYSGGIGEKGAIEFTASRHNESASYRAPASVTADAIQADLGSIAKVKVIRRPSGRERTVHPKCLGGAQTYEPGTYEGVIEFNGEEGYTRAKENRVAQLPAWLVFSNQGPCGGGYGEASGPGEPGARLRGISFAGGRGLFFQVNKNGPRTRTVFTASLKERLDGIRIDRTLGGEAPASAFRFGQHLRTATLSPPAPFSGSASLSLSRNSFSPIWTGDLALDFPGRAAISLAGGDVHVSLVHARFNRSNSPDAEIGIRPRTGAPVPQP
jgi:hypothetical protein